jgi:hypothetical protein
MSNNHQALIDGLTTLHKYAPDAWVYPCNAQKMPAAYHRGAPDRHIIPSDLSKALKKGELMLPCPVKGDKTLSKNENVIPDTTGFKLLTGRKFSYQCQQVVLIAIDVDGDEARETLNVLRGDRPLPPSVTWSSGKHGRCTYLYHFSAGAIKDTLKNKSLGIKDGRVAKVNGGKLEIIANWPGVVVPPSAHAETDGYTFWDGRSFTEIAIAELPDYFVGYLWEEKRVKSLDDIKLPVDATIPLIECCSKEVRQLVNDGVPEGSGHNDQSIAVALELVAVQRYLDYLGQSYDADATSYFTRFLVASNVDGRRAEGRIEWAKSKNIIEPACKQEGVNNCIRGWYWTEHLKNNNSFSQLAPASKNKAITPEQSALIWEQLKALYHSQNNIQDIELGIAKIAFENSRQRSEIERLYQSVCKTLEQDLAKDLANEEFSEFQLNTNLLIDIADILPPELAVELKRKAKNRFHPLRYLAYLWPACGTLVGAKAHVVDPRASDWQSYFIFYCIDMGLKGDGKTPAGNSIMYYLLNKVIEADQEWVRLQTQLKNVKRAWKRMTPAEREHNTGDANLDPDAFEDTIDARKKWIFNNPTVPAVLKFLSEQDPWHSAILFNDELASLIKGFNQYSKGDGNDKEYWLQAFNGRSYYGSERVTEGKTHQLRGQLMQIAGGMQPDVFRQHLSLAKNQDGLTDRFLICDPPEIDVPMRMDFVETNHVAILNKIFKSLESIPVDKDRFSSYPIYFESDAAQYWEKCWVRLNQLKAENRTKNPNFSGYCAKLITYFPRLAGILSLIWQAHYRDEDEQFIPAKIPLHIAEKTWSLICFYATQYVKAAAMSDESANPLSKLMLDIWSVVERDRAITPRQVIQYFGSRNVGQKFDSAFAKNQLQALADNGYGIIEPTKNSGIRLTYKAPSVIKQSVFKLPEIPKQLIKGCVAKVLSPNYGVETDSVCFVFELDHDNDIAHVMLEGIDEPVPIPFKHLAKQDQQLDNSN